MKLSIIKKTSLAVLTLTVASLLYAYDFLVRVGPGVLMPDTILNTGLSQHEVIITNSLFYYGYAFMQIPAGVLIDHYGPKKMLIAGATAAGLSMILIPLTPHFWTMSLLRFICGAGVCFAYIAPLIYAHYKVDRKYFAMIGGCIQIFGSFGAIMGTLPVSIMLTSYGWGATNVLIGIIGIACGILFLTLHNIATKTQRSFTDEWNGLKDITQHLYTWLFGMLGLILWSPMLVIAENLGVSLLEARHIPHAKASLFILVMWLCSGLAGPFMGLWSHGSNRQRFRVINTGLSLCLIGVIGFIYLPKFVPWLWIMFSVLMGSGSATQCVVFGLIDDVTSEAKLATAIGFQNMCISLAGLIILPVISLVATKLPLLHSSSVSLTQTFQESMLVLPFVLVMGLIASKTCEKRLA